MSIRWMNAVWSESRHSGAALLVLLAIADHANDEGVCWPSIERLAKKARVTERHAKRIIADLEAAGELEISRGAGRKHTSTYRLNGDILRTNADADSAEIGDICAQIGDMVSPIGAGGAQEKVTSAPGKGDILREKVTSVTQKGDIAMSPKPSVEPPIEPPSEPSVCFVGGEPPTPTAPDLNDHEVASLVAERAGDWSRFLRSLAWVCHGHDRLDTLTKDQLGALTREAKRMFADGFRRDDLQRWLDDEWRPQWASRHAITGSYPRPLPHQVRASIPAIRASQRTFDATGENALSPPLPAPHDEPLPAPRAETPLDSTWRAVLVEVLASQPPSSRVRAWLAGSTLQEAGAVEDSSGRAIPLYRLRLATPDGESWVRDRLTVPIRRALYSRLHTQVLVEVTAPELEVVA